jgi:hypothetical protein
MPEGFSAPTVSESVELANDGGASAAWELWARYEVGEAAAMLARGTLSSGATDLLQLLAPGGGSMLRPDEPYALELRSDSDSLRAFFHHDDFGAETGQHFTSELDDSFAIPRLEKDADDSRDFVVFYNPGAGSVQVTLELVGGGQTFTFTKTVEGQRRGGWNINQIGSLPEGEFAARITSSSDIVLGGTRYDLSAAAGTAIAPQELFASAGALLSVEFDGGSSLSDDTLITLYNPSGVGTTVSFTTIARDGGIFTGPASFGVQLGAGEARTVSLQALGFSGSDDEFSLIYESDEVVAVAAVTERQSRLVFAQAESRAATSWVFTQGELDDLEGDEARTEDVFLFNPTGSTVDVTVTWTFSNGQTVTETKRLNPLEIEDPDGRIDLPAPVQNLTYTVRVEATSAIVATLERWDPLGRPLGSTGLGVPLTGVTPLSSILVI